MASAAVTVTTNPERDKHWVNQRCDDGECPACNTARYGVDPPDPDHALALLRAGLLPLYLHYLDDHASRLTAAGRPELAEAFGQWWTRLID